MGRYFLEVLILLQGIVIGWIFFSFSDEALQDPRKIIGWEMLVALCIIGFITYIAFRLDWSARVLYQRRAATIIESRRRLHRSHRALQQLARNQAHAGDSAENALADICETAVQTLEVSSVSIWMFHRAEQSLERRLAHDAEHGLLRVGVRAHARASTPYMQELNENKVIAITKARTDERSRNFFTVRAENTCSVLDAPIFLDGELVAILCHDQRGRERSWTSEEENFVASLADLAALVLETEKRKRSEEELRRRSLAIESALDGMAILDRNERFVYLNQAHAAVYGYENPDELIGAHWSVLYTDSERVRFERELMPILLREGKLCAEARGKRKNGKEFPQEVLLTCVPGGGLICTVRDISARKLAERKLVESQQFLRTVVDATPHLIFVKDREGRFAMANQAVADLYGTQVEKLIGKTDRDFNGHDAELNKFYEDDLKVIDTGEELFIAEELVTDAQGTEHVFQTIKRPLFDPNRNEIHVLGVATDITQTKTLHQQLVQSQKMEAIGQLAGGIAHDFNNLLTGVIGYADLLIADADDPDEVKNAAEMISNAARRASELTDKLLGFARKGKHQHVVVDLHRSIKDAVKLIERTVERDIVLVEQFTEAPACIAGDPVQIEQVLLNLVINARDAVMLNKQGGGRDRITLATRVRSIEQGGHPELQPGDYLEMTVSDTGCGVPESLRHRIFEPFFTTKESGKGTGMGLAMVYGIVRNHGGSISVESEVGAGSSFKVLLPLSQKPVELNRRLTESPLPVGKGNVLVVDDHPIIREVTKEMLATLGYKVSTVEDGMQAVQFFREHPELCDLVILDMVMPNMGARECIEALKRLDPKVRVVLSTGYGRNEAAQKLLDCGLIGFIQKPYHLERLAETVAIALSDDTSGVEFSEKRVA